VLLAPGKVVVVQCKLRSTSAPPAWQIVETYNTMGATMDANVVAAIKSHAVQRIQQQAATNASDGVSAPSSSSNPRARQRGDTAFEVQRLERVMLRSRQLVCALRHVVAPVDPNAAVVDFATIVLENPATTPSPFAPLAHRLSRDEKDVRWLNSLARPQGDGDADRCFFFSVDANAYMSAAAEAVGSTSPAGVVRADSSARLVAPAGSRGVLFPVVHAGTSVKPKPRAYNALADYTSTLPVALPLAASRLANRTQPSPPTPPRDGPAHAS
jgi:hypothetical protein